MSPVCGTYNKASLTLYHTKCCLGDYLPSRKVRGKLEISSGATGFCRNRGRQKVKKKMKKNFYVLLQ